MSEIKRKFDAVSKKYDEQRKKLIPCFDDFYGTSVSVASVDTETPNILDVGAGTGLLSAFLMERYPEASFTLIDISEKMLYMAKERFKSNSKVKYIAADYSKYNFTEKYDMVVSALSIHHLEDEDKRVCIIFIADSEILYFLSIIWKMKRKGSSIKEVIPSLKRTGFLSTRTRYMEKLLLLKT